MGFGKGIPQGHIHRRQAAKTDTILANGQNLVHAFIKHFCGRNGAPDPGFT